MLNVTWVGASRPSPQFPPVYGRNAAANMRTAAATQTTAPKALTHRDAVRMPVSSPSVPCLDRRSHTCRQRFLRARGLGCPHAAPDRRARASRRFQDCSAHRPRRQRGVALLAEDRFDSVVLLDLDAARGGIFSVRPAGRMRCVSRRYLPARSSSRPSGRSAPRGSWLRTRSTSARPAVDSQAPRGGRRCRRDGHGHRAGVAWHRGVIRVHDKSLELDGGARVAIHAPRGGSRRRRRDLRVHRRSRGSGRPSPSHRRRAATAAAASRSNSDRVAEGAGAHRARAAARRRSPGDDGRGPGGASPSRWRHRRRPDHVAAAVAGSARTWDYRYCWLRDSSLAALAMLRLGLVERALARRVHRQCGDRSGPVPLVRVDGSPPPDEAEMLELAGYGGARPVRIGNARRGAGAARRPR